MFAPINLPQRVNAPTLDDILKALASHRKKGTPIEDAAFYSHDHMVILGTKPEVMGNMSIVYTGTKIAETDGPYLDHSGDGDAIDDRLFDECQANAKFIAGSFQHFEALFEYCQLLKLATAELRRQRDVFIKNDVNTKDAISACRRADEQLAALLASAQVKGVNKIKYNKERDDVWA